MVLFIVFRIDPVHETRWKPKTFLGTPFACPLRLGDRKFVPANHPLDGLLSLFAHLFRRDASRPVRLVGAPRPQRGPSPFVAARHFPCQRNYTRFSAAKAIQILLNPVGAGLKRPPARKSGFAIGYGEKQNYGFITDTSCFHSALCSGGRRDPPIQLQRLFFLRSRSNT